MPTRFGLRINPTGGLSRTLTFALGPNSGANGSISIQTEDDSYQPSPSDVLDAGGGSFVLLGFSDFGLSRTASSTNPWTVWLNAPQGDYNGAEIAIGVSDYVNIQIQFLVEVDGVETELFSAIVPALDGISGPLAVTFGEFSLTVGPGSPGYSNFWTTFNRTRENAPT